MNDLNDKEISVIVSCIKMAGKESFYEFYYDCIKDGLSTVENLLKKFGLDSKEIYEIMEGY